MSELKPCPFCGGTNLFLGSEKEIEQLDGGREEYFAVVCDFTKGGCGACSGYRKGKEEAIEAWNKRYTPEPKPLTLDELKQREGKPVWVKNIVRKKSYWVISRGVELCKFGALGDIFRYTRQDGGLSNLYCSDYGKTWLAFDREVKND